jgi:DNA-binding XRE family transcriptional regulator
MSGKNIELQEWAKQLYMQKVSQGEIAKKVGVSEVTISKWKAAGKWDEMRKSLLLTKQDMIASLYAELEQLQMSIKAKEGYKVADSKEADIRRKLIVDINDLEKGFNIADLVSIAREFIDFVREIDKDIASDCMAMMDRFIVHTLDKQKWGKE